MLKPSITYKYATNQKFANKMFFVLLVGVGVDDGRILGDGAQFREDSDGALPSSVQSRSGDQPRRTHGLLSPRSSSPTLDPRKRN